MLGKNLIQAAAGNAGAAGGLGVEDVFSTWLYTGNSSTQTITNGIDLAGEGGLVWLKRRSGSAASHRLIDTQLGLTTVRATDTANPDIAYNPSFPWISAFNPNGFTLGNNSQTNFSGDTYTSWTFRKAPGFFDVVTYTGNSSNRAISHSLGSVPGTIIIKRTDTSENWTVWHRSLGTSDYLSLNLTDAKATNTFVFNTLPTSSLFYVGANGLVNQSGGTYVAYLFAHDEQIFGESGDQSVIKCGSYTGNGSTTGPLIDLGWEPQWLLVKRSSDTSNWTLFDSMRGVASGRNDEILYANLTNTEASADAISFTATGFQPTAAFNTVNASSSTYIYIAIRRGPLKTPTDATKVFETLAYTNDTNSRSTGFTVDALFHSNRAGGFQNVAFFDRLRSDYRLLTTASNAEIVTGSPTILQTNNGYNNPALFGAGASVLMQAFRRAPGFFDVVAYTGTGSARTVPHNLGVAPELMIVKKRDSTVFNGPWGVYAAPLTATKVLILNNDQAGSTNSNYWDDTEPTATVFSVKDLFVTNSSGSTYIAYLFATCPGVSKVGSYTGTGTTLNVDCGFTAGARFVLIKRTDSTGDWYFWDTARGITTGNDPYLLFNSTAAEVTSTDYIDPLSSGFQISSTAPAAINASGGNFIYLAIA